MSEKLKITFLGTGTSQGIPVIACECPVCVSEDLRDKRLRTSAMLETGGKVFVIDTGPDFRQQMLREKVKRLDAVIFTHEHKDHLGGLDDVRAFNYVLRKYVEVYAGEGVQVALRREYPYIYEEKKYPGIPLINIHTIENKPFIIEGVEFIPIEVMHYLMPVFGYRIGDFTYITDAKTIPEKEKEKIYGSKVIVLNALRIQEHISHFTLDEAVEQLKEFKPERAYLTHISHQLGKHEDVEKNLPDFIRLAYDGLKIEV